MNGPDRRLFLAIDLPPGLARRLAGLAPAGRGVRPVRPEAIHLTLHFLGDVPAKTIPSLAAALDRIDGGPFVVELEGRGTFPQRGPADVLWIGVRESPALADLHARCGTAIRAAGLATESRPFTPHVTVARLAPGSGLRIPAEFLAGPPVRAAAMPVERVVLYASERTTAGPRHETVHVVPLRPADAAHGPSVPER